MINKKNVWIINPYGSLPSESWAPYRSTMIAECLVEHGYRVTQFISNFEHRSKNFRSEGFQTIIANENYTIQVIPTTSYSSHISIKRILSERRFAKNLLRKTAVIDSADFIILADPCLFYYDLLLNPLIKKNKDILILDIIDIWPELFEMVIPKKLKGIATILLFPLYFWRKRLYQYPKAFVAVAEDYLEVAKKNAQGSDIYFEVIYWSYKKDLTLSTSLSTGLIENLIEKKCNGEIWIIYAGTLGENYDIRLIIETSKALSRELNKVKFLIAGDGPLKPDCENSISENFLFLGRLSAAELRLLYPHCQIALSTYKGESTVSMPIKAFDYISFGLPMINSLGRDLGKLILDYQIGINYDPARPDSLYQSIHKLATDETLRERYSNNARHLAPNFLSNHQYLKFVTLIKKIENDSSQTT